MRFTGSQPEFLLVTASDNPDHWLFPKGHLEPGEQLEDAAVRELREEAGVYGEVLGELGSTEFRLGREDVEVLYFLVRAVSHQEADEARQVRWCDYLTARQMLSFDDTKTILDRAFQFIRQTPERLLTTPADPLDNS